MLVNIVHIFKGQIKNDQTLQDIIFQLPMIASKCLTFVGWYFFNTPGVARAVLQTTLLLHSWINFQVIVYENIFKTLYILVQQSTTVSFAGLSV